MKRKTILIIIITVILSLISYVYLNKHINKDEIDLNSIVTNNTTVPRSPTLEQLVNGEVDIKKYYENVANRTIDNVTLKVKEDTITRTGATFILTDKNKAFCEYGSKYKIEVKKNGQWEMHSPITSTIIWDLSLGTPGTEISEVKKDWSKIYGNLKNGEYRLGISVYAHEDEEYVYAEFKIQ